MTPDYPKPIAPPPEVTGEWWIAWDALDESERPPLEDFIADRASQYGADQELEACCEWVNTWCTSRYLGDAISADVLRAARRPKPPSLKELALEVVTGLEKRWDLQCDLACLRRALEALPND